MLTVTPVFETWLSTSVSAAGDRAVAEEALPGAEHHGEDPEAVLVDEVVLEQRLDEARAAVDLDLGAVLALERRDVLGDVAA